MNAALPTGLVDVAARPDATDPSAVEGMPAIETVIGQRWEHGRLSAAGEAIANETAVALLYNGKPHVVMMATPRDLEDFVLGFSLSEGILRAPQELHEVRVYEAADGLVAELRIDPARALALDRAERKLTGRIGCGLCGAQTLADAVRHPAALGSTSRLSVEALHAALAALPALQPLYTATGAVHAAAWIDAAGRLDLVREDVGRHNALDKLIGALIRRDGTIGPGAALITSRASHEMVQKAATVGMEILCAVSAPTALAVRLAREARVTLLAFARDGRHTVYAHGDRLIGVVAGEGKTTA